MDVSHKNGDHAGDDGGAPQVTESNISIEKVDLQYQTNTPLAEQDISKNQVAPEGLEMSHRSLGDLTEPDPKQPADYEDPPKF